MTEEALQIAEGKKKKEREKERIERQRRKGKIYPFECQFQRTARRYKKAFLSDESKEREENNRLGKTLQEI